MKMPKMMMKVHEPPNEATESATFSPDRLLFVNDLVGMAVGADAHELLRRMKLTSQHGQHVHSGMRLALQQSTRISLRSTSTHTVSSVAVASV